VKLSLNVVPPPGPKPQGGEPPGFTRLSEPMRRFACNQKGCCCSGWDIPFRLEDFLRLHEHLDGADRELLTKDLKLVLEQKPNERGEQVLHALKLDGVGENRACRFLEGEGSCGVQKRHGVSALPDLCIDFPAFAYKLAGDGVELWFDPICPEVLEQLDESDEPLRIHQQQGLFGDEGLDLRVSHAAGELVARVGLEAISQSALELIRRQSLDALAAPRAPWKTLAALAHAYRRLRPGNEAAFEVIEPEDPQPFLIFLGDCISAHGADVLGATALRYKRFIWSVDPQPLVTSPRLAPSLQEWGPAFERWLAPREELLWPLMRRWLAHRFSTPMAKGRTNLKAACDDIVMLYGTSLRFAAAFGETLQRPVDRDLYKAAIGSAEFFYRSLNLPREALPGFAIRQGSA
jgi:Fe-S-cluster containining protein